MGKIEFLYRERIFAIIYEGDSPQLQEYIVPKHRNNYWCIIPSYGRLRHLQALSQQGTQPMKTQRDW